MTIAELSEYRKRRIHALEAEVEALHTQNAELVEMVQMVARLGRGLPVTENEVNMATAVLGPSAVTTLTNRKVL